MSNPTANTNIDLSNIIPPTAINPKSTSHLSPASLALSQLLRSINPLSTRPLSSRCQTSAQIISYIRSSYPRGPRAEFPSLKTSSPLLARPFIDQQHLRAEKFEEIALNPVDGIKSYSLPAGGGTYTSFPEPVFTTWTSCSRCSGCKLSFQNLKMRLLGVYSSLNVSLLWSGNALSGRFYTGEMCRIQSLPVYEELTH